MIELARSSKAAAKVGAVAVTLSAFVPNIFIIDDAYAQANASDTLNVTAKIVNPLNIQPGGFQNLNFGSFAVAGTGTFVIKSGSTASISKGFTIGGATAGTALISAPKSATFTLSIPTFQGGASIPLTISGGGASSKTLICKSILLKAKSGVTGVTGVFKNGQGMIKTIKVTGAANTGRVYAGARLTFTGNQVPGTYVGTYTMKITF